MKTEILKPNIIRIATHQEKGDPHYGSCLWAYYDFDLDRYMLNIQSDCGNAAYRWYETPKSESFLELMTRISDGYLIHKLFGAPAEVDVDATVDNVREYLGIGNDESCQDNSLSDEEREEREEALAELEEALVEVSDSYGDVQKTLDDWNDDHGFGLDCIYEHVETDYDACQKRIVEIFRETVQPMIREIVKQEKEKEPKTEKR